jgi:hypothetical protein
MQNFVSRSIERTVFLILHRLHPPIEESVLESRIDMGHDLWRQSTNVFPVIGHIDHTDLLTLNHAGFELFPSDSDMSGKLHLLELGGQGYHNGSRRELVSHIVLNDQPGAATSLNMAFLRDRKVDDDNISTLVRFHNYLQYLKRSKKPI